uniref:SH3 domain-containing protein n=1 Tax=Chelonoidis abingdonii TaxID=106734 RepID=A0A8C0GBR8_CHEAB
MYRALYSFRSAEPNSLPLAAGETFLLLERSNQHWWLVTRAGSGETGYAPASYLQRLQVRAAGGAGGDGLGASWRRQWGSSALSPAERDGLCWGGGPGRGEHRVRCGEGRLCCAGMGRILQAVWVREGGLCVCGSRLQAV